MFLILVFVATAAMAGNDIKMLVNGQDVKSDVAPVMQNDRVLVPIRFVAEAHREDKDGNLVPCPAAEAKQECGMVL